MKIGSVGTNDIDLKGSTIFGGLTFVGLASIVGALLGFWLIDLPGYKQNREVAGRVFDMEVLDHALRAPTAADRKQSLRILRLTDVLDCDRADCVMLDSLLDDDSWVPPEWSEIEPRFTSSVMVAGRHEGPYEPQGPESGD